MTRSIVLSPFLSRLKSPATAHSRIRRLCNVWRTRSALRDRSRNRERGRDALTSRKSSHCTRNTPHFTATYYLLKVIVTIKLQIFDRC